MNDAIPDAKQIFLEALDQQSPEDLLRYLDVVCGANTELRSRVEGLLWAHREVGDFLGGPPSAGLTVAQPITERAGTVIGPYKLLQKIGEGGFGVVYMAEQSEPVERRVALKIIKPGMDTRQVIARFEAERQALAMMDHPNIAKVLDVGTTESGRPYFVMELVKGIPLTKYCDEQHLSPMERLNLFIPVCQAVQHAHQKGIIHRDLKPSNVLIALYDDRPVPKVIDFGVAKATSQKLTEKTLFTHYGQIVGTLEYMSPEQANLNQLDIDTRSDIYSLGVLLYELLTGEMPFDRERLRSAAFDELLRIIREEEPPRPSLKLSTSQSLASIAANRHTEPKTLNTLVRGELDWIVMKALEKDRTRRYETAKDFAADVVRHMEHEPVEAGPPSSIYRFAKLMKRNKVAVGVSAATTVSILVCLLGTSLGLVYAKRGERIAVDALRAKAELVARAKESERLATAARDAEAAERKRAQHSERQSLWHLYVARQYPLINAWKSGSFGLLDQLIDGLQPPTGQPDFRGWEYTYFRDQCNQRFLTLARDAKTIGYSPANSELAISDETGAISIYSCANWRLIRTLEMLRSRSLSKLAWSPDASTIACGYKDGVVSLRSAESGKALREIPCFTQRISSLHWSPDGCFISAASTETLPAEIHILEVSTGDRVKSLSLPNQRDNVADQAPAAAWSPDGSRLVTGHRLGRFLVWDTKTWHIVGSGKFGGNVPDPIAWGPNGRRFATVATQHVCIWDRDGQPITKVHVASARQNALCWLSESHVAVGGNDQVVSIWNVDEQRKCKELSIHASPVNDIVAPPSGNWLVSRDRLGGVRVSNPEDEIAPAQILSVSASNVWSVAWNVDGKRLFTGSMDGGVHEWDSRSGELLGTGISEGPQWVNWTDSLGLVSAVNGGGLSWDDGLLKSRPVLKPQATSYLTFAAVSPDGRWIAVCPGDNDASIFDLRTGERVIQIQNFQSGICAWTCDSSAAFIVHMYRPDARRCILDADLWKAVPFSIPEQAQRFSLAVNRSGDILAIGSITGDILFVDAQTGSQVRRVQGHAGEIRGLDFSPDFRRLASAGSDGVIKIWDCATLAELLALVSEDGKGFKRVKWSFDGSRLAAAAGNKAYIFGSCRTAQSDVH